jgi:hypothetical protein
MKTPNRPPSCDQLPTKPGPYCWRESDGHEWELVTLCGYCVGIGRLWCPTKRAFHDDMQGQWLPIPAAEELVELQAKAKAYDEGQVMMQMAYDANKIRTYRRTLAAL